MPFRKSLTTMFRRVHHNPPSTPQFPDKLDSLGLERNDKGQYVETAAPDSFVEHKVFKDETTNAQLSGAVNSAVRKDVFSQLAKLDILPYYLHQKGEKAYVDPVKPSGPSVTILASDMQQISHKRHVFIVVGDSNQELGIFSWKTTKTYGGISKGTAVGLIESLHSMVAASCETSETPGIIILNPGELLWSDQLGSCMSHNAWTARKRPNALNEPYAITGHNRVAGHEHPFEHVTTFMQHYVSVLVAPSAKIYITALGDSGSTVLKYLNHRLGIHSKALVRGQLEAITLIQSGHDFDAITTPTLQNLLRKDARAWIASQKPKGALLQHAAEEKKESPRPIEETPPEKPESVAMDISYVSAAASIQQDFHPHRPPSPVTSFEDYMKIHNRERYDEVERELAEEGYAHPEIPVASDRPEFDRLFQFPATGSEPVNPIRNLTHVPRVSHRRTREVIDPVLTMGRLQGPYDDVLEDIQEDDEQNEEQEQVTKEEQVKEEKQEDAEDPLKAHPYMEEPANCATYSAGVEDVPEMIFPAVMEDVVEFFSTKMK